jgi:membrane protein DedA with SNARE-associated domain
VVVVGVLGLSTSTLTHLLDMWGYSIVALSVAIESSGIPFPGETMLLIAATYAGAGHLRIAWVIAAAATGAIVGDNLGYTVGRYGGRALVQRYGRYVHIRAEHLDRAEQFFDRYGDRTVFFGRFVAVLRAWVAFLAGMNRMRWPKFLVFNAAGGIIWATVYGLLGYFLGHNLPLLHQIVNLLGVGGIVAAVVVALVAFVLWRRRKARRETDSESS